MSDINGIAKHDARTNINPCRADVLSSPDPLKPLYIHDPSIVPNNPMIIGTPPYIGKSVYVGECDLSRVPTCVLFDALRKRQGVFEIENSYCPEDPNKGIDILKDGQFVELPHDVGSSACSVLVVYD